MELIVQARNMEISDSLHAYIQRKLGKLDRFLPNIREVRVELLSEATRDAASREVVEVTLVADGTFLRAEEATADVYSSVDAVVRTLRRQIERYKDRAWYRRRRVEAARKEQMLRQAEAELESELAGEEEIPPPSRVVRRKSFPVVPMDEQEAIEQMELLGHDFFAFFNAQSGRINVVYRRRDGDYGLIDPVE